MHRLATFLLILLGCLALSAAELIHFNYHLLAGESVRLFWEVDQTNGLRGFEIERSADNEHFQTVSSQILCNASLDYEYTDHPLDGINQSSPEGKGHQVSYDHPTGRAGCR